MPALRPLKTTLTLAVADGKARYQREILGPTGTASGLVEKGDGPVAPNGEVTLTGSASGPGYSYEAVYKGKVDEGIAQFTGTQRWKLSRETGTITRGCTIDLIRAR